MQKRRPRAGTRRGAAKAIWNQLGCYKFRQSSAEAFPGEGTEQCLAAGDVMDVDAMESGGDGDGVDGRCSAGVSFAGWRVPDCAEAAKDLFVGEHEGYSVARAGCLTLMVEPRARGMHWIIWRVKMVLWHRMHLIPLWGKLPHNET